MSTPLDDIYAAAVAIMADVNTAATGTVIQAPTNYGRDFRITPGSAVYQVQMASERDYGGDSNASYPRATVTVAIHHYVLKNDSLVDEKKFLHNMMSFAADLLMVGSTWRAESGIFDMQHDIDPEVSDGERVGNVITFEVSAVVLADAV